MKRVLAIAAHPDDIEFVMAGTLLLLANAGWEVHYFNIANGCCGSMELPRADIAFKRLEEAQRSARLIPAEYYPPICDDLGVFYDAAMLAKVGSVVRRANPSIVLTHSPIDYMEDHTNACRLATTAAFAKNVPNFECEPPMPATTGDVAVYHAQPHGNVTPLGEFVRPQFCVDVSSVVDRKRSMLECHESQKGWLGQTQKMSSYVQSMFDLGAELSRQQAGQGYWEGWRQRNPLGFGPMGHNPLATALAEFIRLPN